MSEQSAVSGTQDAPPGLPSLDQVSANFTGGSSSDPNIPPQGGAATAPDAVAPVEPTEAPKAPEAKVEPRKPDPQASRFAALSRKEKEVREQRETVAREKAELTERLKAINERDQAWATIKKDPIGALRAAGLSMSDIVQASVGRYEAPPEDPVDLKVRPAIEKSTQLEKEHAALKKEFDELKNQLAGREQQAQYDMTMDGIRNAAKADPDKFELINSMGDEAIDLVRDTMVEYFAQHKKILDYSDACGMVEKYYEDELLGRLSNTKKLKGKLAPLAPAAPSPKQAPTKSKESPTLTNRQATAAPANVDIDKLPREEAIQYLANKLKFQRS